MRIEFIPNKSDIPCASYELIEDKYMIYEDKFGRKWKLIPINNPAIESPFIISPIFKEKK